MINNPILESVDPDIHYFNFNESNSFHMCKYYSPAEYGRLTETNQNLTIFNYNIRSFNANSESLFTIFRSIGFSADVLILSETWYMISVLSVPLRATKDFIPLEKIEMGVASQYMLKTISLLKSYKTFA